MTTVLKRVQPGFRLFTGETLNSIIDQVNALTPGFEPLNTAIATVGADTLTAAAMLGGVITRTGSTAAFTDTTDTGTALDTALGADAITGFSRLIQIKNNTAFAETIAGGTGVTVSGRTVVTPNSVGSFLLTRTGTATYTLVGIAVVPQSIFGVQSLVATADSGATQTLTAAMVAGGMQTYHVSSGGTTPSLTMPLGTDMDTAIPDMRIGQAYTLRIINRNSGIATVVTNTGWTTTGTLTLAANTWRDFVVTRTAVGTYTLVAVGTGTDS